MIFSRPKKVEEKQYKFLDLRTYSSPEWLADGRKKYRRVFESAETNFVFAELSFHNLFFERREWQLPIALRAFKIGAEGREQLCEIGFTRTVHPDESVIYIREAWGHQDFGHFWKRGDFMWEAWMGDELVGSTFFYIEDGGGVSEYDNPYFTLSQIRLFEGGVEPPEQEDRFYYKQFSSSDTRYVWVELTFDNLQSRPWFCELQFFFTNQTGQLKGRSAELRQIREEEDEVVVVSGWGTEKAGTWFNGKYALQVVFMDQLIAVVPFECGDFFVEGTPLTLTPDQVHNPAHTDAQSDDKLALGEDYTMESLMAQLNAMIGLSSVKTKISDYIEYLSFLKLRRDMGFDESQQLRLHTVLKGSPGTGKTTVARLLGRIFHKMGLLSNGRLHEVGRAELIGQFIGQTAPKVKEMIQMAQGGVLFIDEAYSLARAEDDDKDYGNEVIEILVKEMSDGTPDLAIFVAGYSDMMDNFLKANPGLKSKFKLTFEFPDYLPQELAEIADMAATERGVRLTAEARAMLTKRLTDLYRERDKSFGNARLVHTMLDEAKMAMGIRVMREIPTEARTREILETVTVTDIHRVIQMRPRTLPEIGIDTKALDESMAELDSLIGLSAVKREVHELVQLVRFYRESGQDVLGKFSLHTAFKGNPGTGKTTVARILANIYKALGILERGHLVELDRQGLVAGFVGQTAIKTKEQIDKAIGGILFIDEAYALQSNTGDYGKEAIEVLLKEMEDRRGQFIVVVAGYTDEMNQFLKVNPGFKSRFDRELLFEDLSMEELMEVGRRLLAKEQLFLSEEAAAEFQQHLRQMYETRDRYFGNARAVRKLVESLTRVQHLRMATLTLEQRTEEILQAVTVEDVRKTIADNTTREKSGKVGYRLAQ